MIFRKTEIEGAYIVEAEPQCDERGSFARTFCRAEFRERGLSAEIEQCSISYNKKAGTLRGMHYQTPHEEAKLVSVTAGAVYDVILDLRPISATYLKWAAVELTATNGRALYIPEGVAHGFQTLFDDTNIFYQISASYNPASARGVRWNDPAFGIEWPETDKRIISERDRGYSDF